MRLLILLGVLAVPADAPPSPAWKVNFQGPMDAASLSLACQRTAPDVLECISLDRVLMIHEVQIREAIELERRQSEQRSAWEGYDL